MSLLLSESPKEKGILLVKLISSSLESDSLTADEIHYVLDVLLSSDMLKQKSFLDLYEPEISEIWEKLSYYEPNEHARQEVPEMFYGEKELFDYLSSFIKAVVKKNS